MSEEKKVFPTPEEINSATPLMDGSFPSSAPPAGTYPQGQPLLVYAPPPGPAPPMQGQPPFGPPGDAPPPAGPFVPPSQAPPPYAEAIAFIPAEPLVLPPQYFDFNQIPEGVVLYPSAAPPVSKPSNVKSRVKMDGDIISDDPRLDYNPDEIWNFFMSNLKRPDAFVHLEGYHMETRYRQVRDSDGNTRTESYQQRVTDFSFDLDFSAYISPQWARIVCVPEDGEEPKTYRQTLEEYTQSKNWFKSIHLHKQILCDFGQLRNSFVYCIRNSGYPHQVTISFPVKGGDVEVATSHPAGKMSRDNCMRFICCITCLCIIFAPIYFLTRHKTSNKIVAEYPMLANVSDIYMRNYYYVQHLVMSRSHGHYRAY